jgi:Ca-activated chloride channel family protein
MIRSHRLTIASVFAAALVATVSAQDGFRFTSGIELVNVTATVTDDHGRFIDALRKDDFTLYENGVRQEISHFSSGKVPVSLGIALDTSASMTDEKMAAARAAIDRLVFDLLDQDDELFFVKFSSTPELVHGWTRDKNAIRRAVQRVSPAGGTAIYDAVRYSLPIAGEGKNRKKAILVISDGNDTNSDTSVTTVRNMIRESDVLVYALGVDGTTRSDPVLSPDPGPAQWPPFPWPGSGRPRRFPPIGDRGGPRIPPAGQRVNGDALRMEPKDGRWHPIRVEVRDRKLLVRARRGYQAS